MRGETLVFPRLNQRQMAAFLGIKANRLEQATSEGRIARDEDGLYPCERVTEQWLAYERGLHAKSAKRSEFERQRAPVDSGQGGSSRAQAGRTGPGVSGNGRYYRADQSSLSADKVQTASGVAQDRSRLLLCA